MKKEIETKIYVDGVIINIILNLIAAKWKVHKIYTHLCLCKGYHYFQFSL